MKPFIAMIGFPNDGKLEVIGSITGVRFMSYRGYITDEISGEKIYVIGSSPQEQLISDKDFTKNLKKAMSDKKCRGVICSIQATAARKKMTMERTLELAQKAGFRLHLYTMDPPREASQKKRTPDVTAAVEERIAPFGLKIKKLNGLVFPVKNAQSIIKDTKIIS